MWLFIVAPLIGAGIAGYLFKSGILAGDDVIPARGGGQIGRGAGSLGTAQTRLGRWRGGAAYTSRLCSTAAPMKEANSGCGSKGRDLSSGWNCTPMNQGWSGSSMISGSSPSGDMPEKRKPAGLELVAIARVHFVAVAVALGDAGRAVDLGDLAALGEHRLIGAEPHRCRRDRR